MPEHIVNFRIVLDDKQGVDWSKRIRDVVDGTWDNWRDEIVERAANSLVESLKGSEEWKGKLAQIEEEEMECQSTLSTSE